MTEVVHDSRSRSRSDGAALSSDLRSPEFFDRIYVINLVDRKDRLKEITRELHTLGMTFADANVRVFAATRCREARGFPSASVRGCFLSHLGVLLQARADGLRNVLIMEDDLSISTAFRDFGGALFQEAERSPWGFIYFGHRESTSQYDDPRLIPYTESIWTAHFYAVHGSIFDRLIDYLQAVQVREPGDPVGGPMHYDGALTMFRAANPDIPTLIAAPSLGWQRSSRSDIHGNWYDKVWGIRTAADIVRSRLRRNRDLSDPTATVDQVVES